MGTPLNIPCGIVQKLFWTLDNLHGKTWRKSPHLAIVGLHFTCSTNDYVNLSNEEYVKIPNEWGWHQNHLTCGRLQRSPYQDASGFQNLFVDDLAGSGDISSSRGCREWAKGGSLRRGETRKISNMLVLMVRLVEITNQWSIAVFLIFCKITFAHARWNNQPVIVVP